MEVDLKNKIKIKIYTEWISIKKIWPSLDYKIPAKNAFKLFFQSFIDYLKLPHFNSLLYLKKIYMYIVIKVMLNKKKKYNYQNLNNLNVYHCIVNFFT